VIYQPIKYDVKALCGHKKWTAERKEEIDTEPTLFDVVFLDAVQFGQIQVSNQIEEFDADSSHFGQNKPNFAYFSPLSLVYTNQYTRPSIY
jgi:hypothetical protein